MINENNDVYNFLDVQLNKLIFIPDYQINQIFNIKVSYIGFLILNFT